MLKVIYCQRIGKNAAEFKRRYYCQKINKAQMYKYKYLNTGSKSDDVEGATIL